MYPACKSVVNSLAWCFAERLGQATVKLMGTVAASHVLRTDDDYVLSFSDIEVNLDRGIVTRRGLTVDLTPAEYELLICFLLNAGRDLSRDAILESVWSYLPSPNTRTVDAHVLRLRKKLERDPNAPRYFITLHKVGYRFCPSGGPDDVHA